MSSPRSELLSLLILGTLAREPLHAYALKKELQATLGHFMSVSDGTLYPLVRRLETEGLIESHEEAVDGGPDRVVYARTGIGAERFDELMREETPEGKPGGAPHFYTRVALFGLVDEATRKEIVDARRRVLDAERETVRTHASDVTDRPYHGHLLDLTERLLETERTWLDALEDD